MVRYGKEHKQAARQRIIETAGRRFKRDGIDASGVVALMADARLTAGAFYGHFASKDELVASVVADQLREQREGICVAAQGGAGIEELVRSYLSAGHRDERERGCPSAALLDEIGRGTDATKAAYTVGALAVIDNLAATVAAHDPQSLRIKALSLYAAMVGTLQISRALTDQRLADAVLEQGIQNVLALLGGPQPT